jgi:hypothetical protein
VHFTMCAIVPGNRRGALAAGMPVQQLLLQPFQPAVTVAGVVCEPGPSEQTRLEKLGYTDRSTYARLCGVGQDTNIAQLLLPSRT